MKKSMILLVTVGSLLLAACGSSGDGGGASSSPTSAASGKGGRNAADVTFAQGMLPHHEQAVQMADMALEKTDSAEIKDLATRIRDAQKPEIETLKQWLDSWGESADGGMSGMGGDSGSGGMMMSDSAMKDLEKQSGAAFDKMFLTSMIEHHTSAVAMAKTELAEGEFQGAKDMAQAIVDSQTEEITEMKQLLSTSYK